MPSDCEQPPVRVSETAGPLQHQNAFFGERKEDPWASLVLSLDGGGVRGLSSLFIIRRIVERVQQLLDEDPDNNPFMKAFTTPARESAGSDSNAAAEIPELLPCYFFDFIVGTSTGGLIAVMLGRLRMSIDECIMEYWKFNNYIFRPQHHIRKYDAKKLETAIQSVIGRYCGCQGPHTVCHGDVECFRQYDYAEKEDPDYDIYGNQTCKVAIVSYRKEQDYMWTYLWRTYSHCPRYPETNLLEHNAKETNAEVKMWEVCRATTAAPLHFDAIVIRDQEYVDGWIFNNNPSNIAWNEALYMGKQTMSGDSPDSDGEVALLLSVGTGKMPSKRTQVALKLGLKRKTLGHEATQDAARRAKSPYYRLSVRPVAGKVWVSGIFVSACKKRRRQRVPCKRQKEGTLDDNRPTWYRNLQTQATEEHKGGYKPRKYVYSTFEKLFQRTQEYCDAGKCEDRNQTVEDAIKECAAWLVDYARRREAQDPERWRRFISHPNPNHSKYLQPRQETPEE